MHEKLIPVSTVFERWFCAMLKVLQFPEKINQYNILFMFQNTFDVYDGNKKYYTAHHALSFDGFESLNEFV